MTHSLRALLLLAGSYSRLVRRNVHRPQFSIAPAAKSGIATRSDGDRERREGTFGQAVVKYYAVHSANGWQRRGFVDLTGKVVNENGSLKIFGNSIQ